MKLKVVYSVCSAASGTRNTYIARSPSGNEIQAVAGGSSRHASTTLKSCLALICYTRPDLTPSASADHAVSVLDILESEELGPNERVFEGKGMMGWLLAESTGGTTRITGRVIEGQSDSERTLEIVLELMPVSLFC